MELKTAVNDRAYDIAQCCCLCWKTGAIVPATISSHCCSIPFTLNGNVHYSCTDDGFGVGCFYGDREWKLCRQPAGNKFPT